MRFNGLDLNLLVALDALLTERNVTVAGERVFLSQSAMSGALSRLREYFGDDLFVQVGRKMVLTPLAEGLVQPVRDILLQVDATISTKPVFDPAAATRSFSIAASDYVITVLLAEALRHVQRIAPGVTFDLRLLDERSRKHLETGEIDFFVVPVEYTSPDHPKSFLFQDDYLCVAWAENGLVGESLSQEEYARLGHVVHRHGATRNLTTDEAFLQRVGATRRIEVVAPSISLLPQLIVGTNRIATVPKQLAMRYARRLPLKLLSPPIVFPPLQEVVQWHKYRERDPGSIWMRGVLKKAAEVLATRTATPDEPAGASASSLAEST